MPLPSTGPISLSQVNVELGRSSTATISLGESAVRSLAGVASGAISLQNLYGKANAFSHTITGNQTNLNLRTYLLNVGWNGSSAVTVTVNSGVALSSNSTSIPALTIAGSFPGGIVLINNGTIAGMGGAGGRGGGWPLGGDQQPPLPGGTGGTGLSVTTGVTIRNNGTIAGGGGGGGGGPVVGDSKGGYAVGGGGGGGRSGASGNSAGGAGGIQPFQNANLPRNGDGQTGGVGTFSGPGARGLGTNIIGDLELYAGGDGGQWGSSGGSGQPLTIAQEPFHNIYFHGAGGGGGGAAITGNGNISWLAFGTRLGAIT